MIEEPDLGGAYVYGPNLEDGHFGDTFRIRLFDPTRDRVHSALLQLRATHGSQSGKVVLEHKITGIEVAIDFYPTKTRRGDNRTGRDKLLLRAQMSELLRKHFRIDPAFRTLGDFDHFDELPRCKHRDGTYKLVSAPPGRPAKRYEDLPKALLGADNPRKHKTPLLNSTVYVGAKSIEGAKRPVLFRLQDKVGDRRRDEEDYVGLDLDDRRSRIEVCLLNVEELPVVQGLYDRRKDEMQIDTVDDLTKVDWSRVVGRFFVFHLPTFAKQENGAPTSAEPRSLRRPAFLG